MEMRVNIRSKTKIAKLILNMDIMFRKLLQIFYMHSLTFHNNSEDTIIPELWISKLKNREVK